MSQTYEQLVQEIGARYDGAFLSTATGGASNQLVDATILQRVPRSVANDMNWWFYGTTTADGSNKGVERRAQLWDSGATRITFYTSWPTSIASGTYEVHPRIERVRKMKAINAAVGQLGLVYWRDFVDTTLTTVNKQWKYTIPASIPVARVSRVELQVNTDTTAVGFPYVDATPWNYDVHCYADSSGTMTWEIQFGIMPPPSRTIRIWGEAYATQLVQDSDVLPLYGKWEQPALEWIFDYGQYLLNQQVASKVSEGDSQRWRQQEFDRLQTSKEKLLLMAPAHANSIIAVPGRGDGLYAAALGNDGAWLGAFHGAH